ncbi:sugar phosphate isomerase/epimerase family protein [Paenarthrobacter ureafaciens]|uniref:sugar phosphate isomerase/epimerase family protein n=1 Tax=Paenarthrobacter ureafaciens TaxID=37931 RepID=UPI001916E5C0|nr:sugar phosphate isomerase/epimerase family protein [Paenarthrobacter ureafaciens]MEC3852626.1 sugar phosphate isomerase/epimerase family protein [Paenarthrobacter ureafaciens]QQQ63186.1 sugar phosphate isomerase/epimerase [Paenarthrobacter ureafaciens]UOD82260.1 sugar phosphate isomerase/epimerase [Paenarthrobacter ureafaciens]WNZ05758.1 sugar phosphate isomerase/epimerase [Paenarthrobacter ureafaciens]
MAYTAENWPITAALLQFPGTDASGQQVNDADASVWASVFQEVKDAGFANADLTDSWVRPGDLSKERLAEFKQTADEVGVGIPVISAIRRSVIHERDWEDNLAYSHRTIDAAAELGCEVVSIGLHQAITPEQQKQLWFWTVEGYKDPVGDKEAWGNAVSRIREIGKHAAEAGILVSLEMYEDTYLGTGDSSVQLVQDIGLDNVGLNPDLGNLIRLHRPIEDWRELVHKTLPYSNYWHMKNYIRDEDVARDSYITMPAPMESGLINYREAFKYALSVGFQGILCVEHYGGDGLSVTASNQDYLRRHVLPKNDGYALGQSKVAQGRQQPASTQFAGV